MNQLPLGFDAEPPPKRSFSECVPNRLYDGETFEPTTDHRRLHVQHAAVFEAMRDGRWRTLVWISTVTGSPQASISARLRDFRKEKFGGHTVNRRRVKSDAGTFEYQLLLAVREP